jgi:ankyrin repeat protein
MLLPLLLLLLLCPQMLQHGGDVNVVDYDQRTGLMLAAAGGHTAAVRKLIESGAHVNHQDKLGSSALLEAVKAGHDAVIE